MEVIRCFKRYLARHLYRPIHDTLTGPVPTPDRLTGTYSSVGVDGG